jgi:hypothetical protein|tara:strand:+ start:1057 stop:1218 length:162 start_codon:yes stop_codon:yes gene_type:complete
MPMSKSKSGKMKKHSTMSAAKKRAKKTGGKAVSLPKKGARNAAMKKTKSRRRR